MQKRAKNEVSGNFLSLVHWFDSILYIMIKLNGLHDLAILSIVLDHSKIGKMSFWTIKIAKNEIFSQFRQFGSSDWLDIAYFDRTKWYARFGFRISHAESFKNQKTFLFEWSKWPKTRVLVIFLSLVHRIDSILHILIELIDSAIVLLMLNFSSC